MKFKFLGTEFYISFLFAAVITIMLATDRTGMVMPTLFAIFMHEVGHLFAMWALDCSPKQIRLIPTSVQIINNINVKYKKDIFISFCGPIVNFILFFTFYFNYLVFKNELTLYYAALNLIIGVFNLLPVNGLDGGTILYSLLCRKLEIGRAMLIMRIITGVVAVVTIFFAVWMLINGRKNISLFIIGIYLLITSLLKM